MQIGQKLLSLCLVLNQLFCGQAFKKRQILFYQLWHVDHRNSFPIDVSSVVVIRVDERLSARSDQACLPRNKLIVVVLGLLKRAYVVVPERKRFINSELGVLIIDSPRQFERLFEVVDCLIVHSPRFERGG